MERAASARRCCVCVGDVSDCSGECKMGYSTDYYFILLVRDSVASCVNAVMIIFLIGRRLQSLEQGFECGIHRRYVPSSCVTRVVLFIRMFPSSGLCGRVRVILVIL